MSNSTCTLNSALDDDVTTSSKAPAHVYVNSWLAPLPVNDPYVTDKPSTQAVPESVFPGPGVIDNVIWLTLFP